MLLQSQSKFDILEQVYLTQHEIFKFNFCYEADYFSKIIQSTTFQPSMNQLPLNHPFPSSIPIQMSSTDALSHHLQYQPSQLGQNHLPSSIQSDFYPEYLYGLYTPFEKAKMEYERQNYDLAIEYVKIMRGSDNFEQGIEIQGEILLIECLIAKNDYVQGLKLLQDLRDKENQENQINLWQLQIKIRLKTGQEKQSKEALRSLSSLIENHFGCQSIQYGQFMIRKSEVEITFSQFSEALQTLSEALSILLKQKEVKNETIYEIYSSMALCQQKLAQLNLQYSALVCAKTIAKKSKDAKSVLKAGRRIVKNNLEREQTKRALEEIKQLIEIEKKVFGQNSKQVSTTRKKMKKIEDKMMKEESSGKQTRYF